ncbi:glycosyltransferase [Pontibacter sp. BT310]|uniref:Glycosyltransferase n=1 Tax=Pontibacter populi TaxID=890055 RepID=A0ABS6XF78_9BACT|nr:MULTISPECIES: glycosyltransferase [Pontibacter]MBJ6119790.1 glycosyltransferase [Pontibacter sp. BT310]MBR0572219.1 glycosyltransferase [Microvirga sp. STS03]MBW3366643.1 glycosyltransferase [Pontibacter populi]
MSDLVSVCIPVYNGEKYLKESLKSVISQSYKNIEILIVDDGSTDNSLHIITEFKEIDNRIRLIQNKQNLGLVKNWQKCIELAKGNWIKFLFQDDIMHSECLKKMMNACATKNVKICISGREFIIEDSASPLLQDFFIDKVYRLERSYPFPKKFELDEIANLAKDKLFHNFIGEPIVLLFNKSIIKEVGNYNPDLVQLVDYEFSLRACLNFPSYFLPDKLVSFRVHSASESSKNQDLSSIKILRSKFVEPLVMYHEYLFNPNLRKLRKKIGFKNLLSQAVLFYIENSKTYSLPSDIKAHIFSKYYKLHIFKAINLYKIIKSKL